MSQNTWVLDLSSCYFSKPYCNQMVETLIERNQDYVLVTFPDILHLRAIVDTYCRYFFVDVDKTSSDFLLDILAFPVNFIKNITDNPTLLKAFELFIFLEQKDQRNAFIFETLISDVRLDKELKHTYSYNSCKLMEDLRAIMRKTSNVQNKKEWQTIMKVMGVLLKPKG